MARLGIAIDLGTSGFRAQALDLTTGKTISTAITTSHPVPGSNVIDHIQFALEFGASAASHRIIEAINRIVTALRISPLDVERLAVCGNPAQISLFQGSEVRDLAYSGRRKLVSLGIASNERNAAVRPVRDFPGLALPPDCRVFIPPAVGGEIGADTLALIIKTRMHEKEQTIFAIDVGTNAEMVLYHDGRFITGSAAAGPAIEGKHITCGMLAAPGAISDISVVDGFWQVAVLNTDMIPVPGGVVDLAGRPRSIHADIPVIGVTGTGLIAAIGLARENGLIALPHITSADRRVHLAGENIYITENDVAEVGKAVGAIRAGYCTLCHTAGIPVEQVHTAYMAGASGTYVDPVKAQRMGIIPPQINTVYQAGNTSLAMARDVVLDPGILDTMSDLANTIRQGHCLFAESPVFKKLFLLEFSYWTEGMPWPTYRALLKKYALSDLLPVYATPENIYRIPRDIVDLGEKGMMTVPDDGSVIQRKVEGCDACRTCQTVCPANALTVNFSINDKPLALQTGRCRGASCRACEQACPKKVFSLAAFFDEHNAAKIDQG